MSANLTKLGLDCKLYYQSSGTREAWPAAGAAPNLVEVTKARDVTLTLEKGEADVTVRGSDWELFRATLKSGSVEFDLIFVEGDAGFVAFRDAWLNNTSIAVAVLDGDSTTAGTQGLWADCEVMTFSRNETLREAVVYRATIKPTLSNVAPEWAVVAT